MDGGNRVHRMFSHLAIWIHFRDSLLNQFANKCCRLLVLSRRGTVVLVDGPEKTPAVCDTVPEDNLGSCNIPCTIPCKAAMSTILYLFSVKEKRRWTPAALRRKMLHFHNMSTYVNLPVYRFWNGIHTQMRDPNSGSMVQIWQASANSQLPWQACQGQGFFQWKMASHHRYLSLVSSLHWVIGCFNECLLMEPYRLYNDTMPWIRSRQMNYKMN